MEESALSNFLFFCFDGLVSAGVGVGTVD